jgi:hypothetical protein
MPDALSSMRLSGDEDCGVSLLCYRDECDPYHHGEVAYYGDHAPAGKPSFKPDQLAAFIEFIHQHAASHPEGSDA